MDDVWWCDMKKKISITFTFFSSFSLLQNEFLPSFQCVTLLVYFYATFYYIFSFITQKKKYMRKQPTNEEYFELTDTRWQIDLMWCLDLRRLILWIKVIHFWWDFLLKYPGRSFFLWFYYHIPTNIMQWNDAFYTYFPYVTPSMMCLLRI